MEREGREECKGKKANFASRSESGTGGRWREGETNLCCVTGTKGMGRGTRGKEDQWNVPYDNRATLHFPRSCSHVNGQAVVKQYEKMII